MIRLGFLLDSLAGERASQFIKAANNYLEKNYGIEVITFIQNHGIPSENPLFATLNLAESFAYNGIVIATSLDTASKLPYLPGPSRKVFYLTDYCWVHDTSRSFKDFRNIFANEAISVIASSDELARDCHRIWGTPVLAAFDNFNIEHFKEVLQ